MTRDSTGKAPRPRRLGIQLTEVLVALALAVGPMILAFQLVERNSRGAAFNRDRATARLVLLDVAEVIQGEPVDRLRQLAADPGLFRAQFDDRIASLPVSVRELYRAEVAAHVASVGFALDERPDPGLPGLVRVSLTCSIGGTPPATVTVSRLLRPEAFSRPRGIPERSRP